MKKRRQRDAKIELTIKEKPGERQKTTQNSTFQIETLQSTGKNKHRNSKNSSNHKINSNF
ncbi:hypothetical protein DRO69_12090 [Candidatus Bathyarchaeota archaeon]|nr:MAG: hypothetical protein DRO69_12090 [Candidatus Bathyarchaeota archaeon]